MSGVWLKGGCSKTLYPNFVIASMVLVYGL